MLLVFSSCNEDGGDDGITRVIAEGDLPLLPSPAVHVIPVFGSADSLARIARGVVIGQLNRVRLLTREIESTHATLSATGWTRNEENCWIRQFSQSDTTCDYTLSLCGRGSRLEYNESMDGPCLPGRDGPIHVDDWTFTTGTTNADGTEGDFRTFQNPGSGGNVSRSWRWSSPDGGSTIDWSFYAGERSDRNFRGALRWNRSDPAAPSGEFRWSSNEKWSAALTGDGTSGRLTILGLDAGSGNWLPQEELTWEPKHGTWNVYDAAGGLAEARSW
ncbi:MAG: hypothetical protein R3E12_00980 [Candidatus Eisenbacteria bacterium]|uniref:Uncharacterized protein n=1 Tax=Eiseniibacteriota bacterium TaxID=2212470 RepID=A0A956LXJ0_UNCEI|nr:hypothetical protein [Candidatus Eisenbacteria bacterium]